MNDIRVMILLERKREDSDQESLKQIETNSKIYMITKKNNLFLSLSIMFPENERFDDWTIRTSNIWTVHQWRDDIEEEDVSVEGIDDHQ